MKSLLPGLAILALPLVACGPQLEFGSYEAALTGSSTTFAGVESAFSATTAVDIAYDKPRGTLTYETTFCGGFVDYLSASPCFNTLTLTDTTDGLIGVQEEAWSIVIGTGEGGTLQGCQGTEQISVAGKVRSDDEADLEVTYHLSLASGSAPGCADLMADEEARIVAEGTLSLVSP